MISLKNISVAINGESILKNVSFEAEDGLITVIIGKNGSGKTTILKTIAGLISATEGNVTVDGYKSDKEIYFGKEIAPLSYVFQKGGLFDSMTVFDNLAFYRKRKGYSAESIESAISSVLKRVGLSGTETRLPSELSGGMQKRVCLARAVLSGAKNILYDDPAAGLDPVLTDSIGELILEIRKSENITSIVSTHDLMLVRKIADRVIVVHKGEIVYNDSSENFFSMKDPYAVQFINAEINGPIEPV